MSSKPTDEVPPVAPEDLDPATAPEERVGYGRPPLRNRFKPGQSGKPKGRPRGSRNTSTIVSEVLDRKITIKSGGRRKQVQIREVMITCAVEAGLQGNLKAMELVLKHDARTSPATLKRVGMEMRHLVDAPQAHQNRKPDRSLLRLLARGRRFRDLILQGDGTSITELAGASGVTPSYFTRIVRLGFLAPDITKAILDGCQPMELSARKLSLASLPKDWSEQRRAFGFR